MDQSCAALRTKGLTRNTGGGLVGRRAGTLCEPAGFHPMPNKSAPDPTKPMSPKAVDGAVVVKDPPEAAMDLTPDAAEISGLRLIDAADRARKRF